MFGFVKGNTLVFKDPYSRLSVYSAFVRSRVEHASFIWNPSGSVQINRIERLQKKFSKFAWQSLHFTEPAPPYDNQCSLLHTCSLKDRRATAGLLFLNDLIVLACWDASILMFLPGISVPWFHSWTVLSGLIMLAMSHY